jgi:hypothetical protein
MKANLDKTIENELISANRYFAQSDKATADLAKQMAAQTPEAFLVTLRQRWAWHNSFYEELLEPSLGFLLESSSVMLSPWQVERIALAYETSVAVDKATLNGEEHRIAKSLVGISGFILRTVIISYLREIKKLKKDGGIYDFDDTEIMSGLKTLLKYRREFMDKGVVAEYRQTSGVTCTAVCLMQIFERYGLATSSQTLEEELYSLSKSRLIPGSHYSALASLAAETGFETTLLHSETGMFKNSGLFSYSTFNQLIEEYEGYLELALKNGTKVQNGCRVDSTTVRKYLSDNYIVLVAGQIGGALHSILATGYTADKLIIHDPLTGGAALWNDGVLDWFMKTLVGSWMLAIRPPTQAIDELTATLPSFLETASRNFQIHRFFLK